MFKHLIIVLLSGWLFASTVTAAVNVHSNEVLCIYDDVGILSDTITYFITQTNGQVDYISYAYLSQECSGVRICNKEHVYPLGNKNFISSKYFKFSVKKSFMKLSGTEVLNRLNNFYTYTRNSNNIRYMKLSGVEVPTEQTVYLF